MTQLQFYKYATWGLLVLNISMLAFFFITKPAPHLEKGRRFQREAIEIMNLNDQQKKFFFQSVKKHSQGIASTSRQQKELLRPYFQNLIKPTEDVEADSLLKQIQALEVEKIEATYAHFQEIKSILKPEQQTGFKHFVNRALGIILF